MTLTLDATVGGANSNTFGTLTEANDYLAARLNVGAWTSLPDDASKNAALAWATRLMEAEIDWTGMPASTTQALAWPRTGMVGRNGAVIPSDVIPQEIKNLQFELALQLASSDPLAINQAAAAGLTSLQAGPVKLTFADPSTLTSTYTFSKSLLSLIPAGWYCVPPDPTKVQVGMWAL